MSCTFIVTIKNEHPRNCRNPVLLGSDLCSRHAKKSSRKERLSKEEMEKMVNAALRSDIFEESKKQAKTNSKGNSNKGRQDAIDAALQMVDNDENPEKLKLLKNLNRDPPSRLHIEEAARLALLETNDDEHEHKHDSSELKITGPTITVGSFNILAQGLSMTEGDFITPEGDAKVLDNDIRLPRLVSIISKMMETCDVLVTQENDLFYPILSQLHKKNTNIRGAFRPKINLKGDSGTARSLYLKILQNRVQGGPKIKESPKFETHKEHDDCYNYVNQHRAEARAKTYLEMCDGNQTLAFIIATYYKHNINDLYESDDGIGFYYTSHPENDGVETILAQQDGFATLTFLNNTLKFTVLGAHLPSGESIGSEAERVQIFRKILDKTKDIKNCIYAMDSNVSPFYEKDMRQERIEYEINLALKRPLSEEELKLQKKLAEFNVHRDVYLSELIRKNSLSDAVDPLGYECLKMRSAMGGQSNKYCEFMFDTIDKILYNPNHTIAIPRLYEQNEFGYHKYNKSAYEVLLKLRDNEENRKRLKDKCMPPMNAEGKYLKGKTSLQQQIFTPGEMPEKVYPNEHAPSDHPPVVGTFMFFQNQ